MLPTPWENTFLWNLISCTFCIFMIHQSPWIQFNRGFDDGIRLSESLFFETFPIINTQLMHNVSEAGSAPSLYCLRVEVKPTSKMLRPMGEYIWTVLGCVSIKYPLITKHYSKSWLASKATESNNIVTNLILMQEWGWWKGNTVKHSSGGRGFQLLKQKQTPPSLLSYDMSNGK